MSLSLYDLNNSKTGKNEIATTTTAGLMSPQDKIKLDGLNEYTHPDTHPVSMITGLATVATTGSYNDLTDKPTTADTLDGYHASDFARLTGQPTFLDADTTATLSVDLQSAPTLGTGWSGTSPYTHATGNVEVLSFPITNGVVSGDYVQVVFTCTGADDINNFKIILGTSTTATTGMIIKDNINYNTTIVIKATNGYNYLNIVPDSSFVGTFTLTSIKKFTSIKSKIMSLEAFDVLQPSAGSIMIGNGGYLTTGSNNTILGYNALQLNTTGQSNVAIGYTTLQNNTTGYYNNTLGIYALNYNTTGIHNIAVGSSALRYNVTGGYNVAVGSNTLQNNIIGQYNTALGYQALINNTTSDNTAVGYNSLPSNTTGTSNTAVGKESMFTNQTGNQNTVIGTRALYTNKTGANNAAIGYNAGSYIADGTTSNTTSDYSIYLGSNTKAGADNNQNEIVIGYNATGKGSNTIQLGNSSVTDGYIGNNKIIHAGNISAMNDISTTLRKIRCGGLA